MTEVMMEVKKFNLNLTFYKEIIILTHIYKESVKPKHYNSFTSTIARNTRGWGGMVVYGLLL
jgi:hypothetical protein